LIHSNRRHVKWIQRNRAADDQVFFRQGSDVNLRSSAFICGFASNGFAFPMAVSSK
jgi:hypothetical protein